MPPVSYSLSLYFWPPHRHGGEGKRRERRIISSCRSALFSFSLPFLLISLPPQSFPSFTASHTSFSLVTSESLHLLFSPSLWRSLNGKFILLCPVGLTRLISFESGGFTGVPLGLLVLAEAESLWAVWGLACSLTTLSAQDTQGVS